MTLSVLIYYNSHKIKVMSLSPITPPPKKKLQAHPRKQKYIKIMMLLPRKGKIEKKMTRATA